MDCEGNQNFVDDEGKQVDSSMVHTATDVVAPILDSLPGTVVYRMYKHGGRTGESFKGTKVTVEWEGEQWAGIIESIEGNSATILYDDGQVEYFDFPESLLDGNVVITELSDDGEIEHIEYMICLGNFSTISYKAAYIVCYDDNFQPISSTYGLESVINHETASKLWARLSKCSALTAGGSQFNKLIVDQKQEGGTRVPVFTDGNLHFTLWDASPHKQIEHWQEDNTAIAGVIDEVRASEFAFQGCAWAPEGLSGDKELSIRVNVSRDALQEGAIYSRCFDSALRDSRGGGNGMSLANESSKQACAVAQRNSDGGVPDSNLALQIRGAASEIAAKMASGALKLGIRIRQPKTGINYQTAPEDAFWSCFPASGFKGRTNASQRDYLCLYAYLAARVNISPGKGSKVGITDELLQVIGQHAQA